MELPRTWARELPRFGGGAAWPTEPGGPAALLLDTRHLFEYNQSLIGVLFAPCAGNCAQPPRGRRRRRAQPGRERGDAPSERKAGRGPVRVSGSATGAAGEAPPASRPGHEPPGAAGRARDHPSSW